MAIKKAEALKLVHRMMQAYSLRDPRDDSSPSPMIIHEFVDTIGHERYMGCPAEAPRNLWKKYREDPLRWQSELMRYFIGVCDDL